MTRRILPVTAVLLSLGAGAAQAADLFDLNLNVTTPRTANAAVGFSTITDLANALQTQNLNNLVNAYTTNSAATATLNIRGLPATVSYQANSPVLRLVVPSAGINTTFNGATRDESQVLFKDFLLQNGGALATKLLQALVATSPIDPVAGNPNSLQNMSAASDFSIATGIGPGGTEIPGGPNGGLLGQPNLVTLGGDIGFATSGGFTSEIFSIPIRYVIPFRNPEYALTIDVPLTYVNTEGTSSYFGSFGVSLRIPVLENWYITPSVRFGASGSVDLGAGALQYSGGVASRYDIFWKDLQITIGDGVTVAKTVGLDIGSINVNYDLTNELFNNGVQVEGSLPYTMFGEPTSWQVYLMDTAVAGSAVYINHYDEIGVSVGTRHLINTQNWNSLRVGLGVVVGPNYNAVKLAFSARF
jgi:hypothetical protein